MKAALSMALGLAVLFALVLGAQADDKKESKEKVLKGTVTCAKCDLKIDGQAKCHTVVQVKEDDKDVIYWFDVDGSKKFHNPICKEAKKGSVTGVVSEKDGKKWIKVSKVEFDK